MSMSLPIHTYGEVKQETISASLDSVCIWVKGLASRENAEVVVQQKRWLFSGICNIDGFVNTSDGCFTEPSILRNAGRREAFCKFNAKLSDGRP